MKVKKILTMNKNSRNGQIVFTLKKMQLKKFGVTPEDFLSFTINKKNRKVKW